MRVRPRSYQKPAPPVAPRRGPALLPARFSRRGQAVVFKQPVGAEELAQCKEAMEQCPVEAIGNNGA
ncbi:MAG: ferredoxin [Planctomycetes bacterium]|nr:ferredoxin [Planctomycetota bacterium]